MSYQKMKLMTYQKIKCLFWALLYSATILDASDGESAFLLTVTGVCQVRSTWSNHSPLVLVIKWAPSYEKVQSRVRTWQKITYRSHNSEMPKACMYTRTEVSSLSTSKTIHEIFEISFIYCSLFRIRSCNAHMKKVRWSKRTIHTDCSICFQLKVTIYSLVANMHS